MGSPQNGFVRESRGQMIANYFGSGGRSTPIQLTPAHISNIRSFIYDDKGNLKPSGFPAAYSYIAWTLDALAQTGTFVDSDTLTWFTKAADVNAGTGAAARFIRSYTANGLALSGRPVPYGRTFKRHSDPGAHRPSRHRQNSSTLYYIVERYFGRDQSRWSQRARRMGRIFLLLGFANDRRARSANHRESNRVTHRVPYNSCRNRHCPRCQGAAARTWLAEREADLLPVGYFHVVFTLPAEVADIAFQNKAVVYSLLFQAASETMTTIAADPRHLGARIGITAVLHSWGSAMTHHPHIHMIVPGGGLSPDGSRWISSRPAFLLPVSLSARCSAVCSSPG